MENKKKKMNLTVDRNRTKYCDKSVKCRYRHNELKYNVKLEMEMRHYLSKWQVEGEKGISGTLPNVSFSFRRNIHQT